MRYGLALIYDRKSIAYWLLEHGARLNEKDVEALQVIAWWDVETDLELKNKVYSVNPEVAPEGYKTRP